MRADEVPERRPDHEAASAAVTAAFSLLPYPISKDTAIEAMGSWPIPYGGGEVPLGRMLDALPESGFESPQEAMQAVDRHWGDIQRALERS